jgi:hypothetical protein
VRSENIVVRRRGLNGAVVRSENTCGEEKGAVQLGARTLW